MNSEERKQLIEKYFQLKQKTNELKQIENEMKGIKTLLSEDFIENKLENCFIDGVGACNLVSRNLETVNKDKVKEFLSEEDYEKCVTRKTSQFLKFVDIDDLSEKKLEEMRDRQ